MKRENVDSLIDDYRNRVIDKKREELAKIAPSNQFSHTPINGQYFTHLREIHKKVLKDEFILSLEDLKKRLEQLSNRKARTYCEEYQEKIIQVFLSLTKSQNIAMEQNYKIRFEEIVKIVSDHINRDSIEIQVFIKNKLQKIKDDIEIRKIDPFWDSKTGKILSKIAYAILGCILTIISGLIINIYFPSIPCTLSK